jgi:hypothetical protein
MAAPDTLRYAKIPLTPDLVQAVFQFPFRRCRDRFDC